MSYGQDGVVGEPVDSFHRTKTQGLEELPETQNQLKRDIEVGVCCGLLTLNDMTTGWGLFSRLQNQIDELIESVRQASFHNELRKTQRLVAQLQAQLQKLAASATATAATPRVAKSSAPRPATPAVTESVFLQGASGKTAAAHLVQVVEAEERGMVVEGEKVMALDEEKIGMMEAEVRDEEQEEQEKQWPLPPQQQQLLQLQSPGAQRPA